VRVNTVPGEPYWLEDDDAPGGRRLNPRAFSIPAPNTQGNLPRGATRGFPVRQVDLAVRREFRLFGRVRLQVRAEMFNLLNTPNFFSSPGVLSVDASGASVLNNNGEATNTLNNTLGGLNPMYQIGGPRSSQISLKLLF
jgi:hypothetical protein